MKIISLSLLAPLVFGSLAFADEFEPADDFVTIQENQRKVPKDDIWWTVRGEQMRWMHLNVHQLFPTVNVYRRGAVSELEYALSDAIGNIPVDTPDGELSFLDFLSSEHSTAMGVVILHEGKIVFEQYPRMKAHEKPIYWSVAKVMPAAVLRIMEERGEVDVSKPIEDYLPTLADSPFAGATVRHLLDMASGVDCADEYENRDSCYYRYSMAIGDGYRENDPPDNPYDFVASVDAAKLADPGTQYSYSGVTTFILGWLAEEISGHTFNDLWTREIWQHIGAEADASFLAYRYGIPLTHGGFVSNMRDLARYGLLYTPSWNTVADEQIISDEHVEMLLAPGNPNLMSPNGFQSIYQWIVARNGNMEKGGWGGQSIMVNPKRDIVAISTSYFRDDAGEVDLSSTVVNVLESVYGEQ